MCGNPIAFKGEPVVHIEQAQQGGFNQPPELVRRQFWLWYVLSLVTGIFYYVYLYMNYEDLNKLDKYRENKEVPSTYTDTQKIIMLLVVGVLLSFVYVFIWLYLMRKKYDLLYNYIRYSPRKQEIIPMPGDKHTKIAVSGFILLYVSIGLPFLIYIPAINTVTFAWSLLILVAVLMFIGAIVCFFYLLVQENKWQQAYNERVLMINPNTPEVLLF